MSPIPRLNTKEWAEEVKFYLSATPEKRAGRAQQLSMLPYSYLRRMRERGISSKPTSPQADNKVVPSLPRQRGKVLTRLTTNFGKMETAVIINDTHNPYEDKVVLPLVEQFLGELQPDYLWYDGDSNDFYPLSKFDKSPERLGKLQGDLDSTRKMFAWHRKILPNTRMIHIDGNHEDRLRRHLWSKDPELASLRALELNELLGFKENEIAEVGYEEGLLVNGVFLVIHGNISSIHSGYTAKRMYEKHGGNGICGHCHRGGSYYKRDRFGIWGWWENFCLCDLDPDYIQNPNWMQGFSIVHFRKRRFWIEQVPIIDAKFIYGGKLYGQEE